MRHFRVPFGVFVDIFFYFASSARGETFACCSCRVSSDVLLNVLLLLLYFTRCFAFICLSCEICILRVYLILVSNDAWGYYFLRTL